MAHDHFIDQHKSAWQRLEDLLKLLDSTSLRRLHREEVRELGRIYRRTASDLAIARAESRDPRLVNYLNSLVIRAHGRIYQADSQGGSRVKNFFVREFPQTFRRTWRYTAVSFSVFMLFAIIGFIGTKYDPEFSELVGVAPAFRELYIETFDNSTSAFAGSHAAQHSVRSSACAPPAANKAIVAVAARYFDFISSPPGLKLGPIRIRPAFLDCGKDSHSGRWLSTKF